MRDRVRLWTAQHESVVEEVFRTGRHDARWDRVDESWRDAYRWMTEQMPVRPIEAPVWTWSGRRTGFPQRAPHADDFLMVSSEEVFDGHQHLMCLEVPAELVLRSDYGRWCDALGDPSVSRLPSLSLEPSDLSHPTSVQVVIPWIESRWVRRTAPFPAALKQFAGGRSAYRHAEGQWRAWMWRSSPTTTSPPKRQNQQR